MKNGLGRTLRLGIGAAILLSLAAIGTAQRASADHDVEHRIALFWERINAMQPGDYLSSRDLGQWALNVIERDPRARLTVEEFRASTAMMQAGIERAGPAPVTGATPTPAPTASTYVTFGDGTKVVGVDVPPGTYRLRTPPASFCYFARLSGFGGTLNDIIANASGSGRAVVTIAATDKGFSTQGCGTWTSDLSAVTTSTTAAFAGGMFIVGVDIAPGTWQAPGGSSCYWSRLSGFGATLNEIVANGLSSGSAVVQIAATDKGFTSNGCGTWTKIG